MKVAVVTPYYKEDAALLHRCLDSVRAQTVACDHFLISDGHPQDFLDHAAFRHIRLGAAHEDFGNTPRGLGAQLAVSEGYDAIAFLDADNWYDDDHIATCLVAARSLTGDVLDCDYVIARRRFVSPDQKAVFMGEESGSTDTSCYLFLPGAFHILPVWNLMPRPTSLMGDHVIHKRLLAGGLVHVRAEKVTVNYHNLWAHTYQARGLPVPDGAKPRVEMVKVAEWFLAQEGRRREIFKRLMGVWFERPPGKD